MSEQHRLPPAEFLVLAIVAAHPELEKAWVDVYNTMAGITSHVRRWPSVERAVALWHQHGLADYGEVDGFVVWTEYAKKHGTIHHGHTLRSADSHQP